MAYLDETGLATLVDNINNKFTKKSQIKLYIDTEEPADAPDGSVLLDPDELVESTATLGTINSINDATPDDNGNVQMEGYLKRNTLYSTGDLAYSTKLPNLYFLECTTAGTTGDAEVESYSPPPSS